MILFDLQCSAGHGFEGWFKDSSTFEAQVEAGELICPVCGDRQIAKAAPGGVPAGMQYNQDNPVFNENSPNLEQESEGRDAGN